MVKEDFSMCMCSLSKEEILNIKTQNIAKLKLFSDWVNVVSLFTTKLKKTAAKCIYL